MRICVGVVLSDWLPGRLYRFGSLLTTGLLWASSGYAAGSHTRLCPSRPSGKPGWLLSSLPTLIIQSSTPASPLQSGQIPAHPEAYNTVGDTLKGSVSTLAEARCRDCGRDCGRDYVSASDRSCLRGVFFPSFFFQAPFRITRSPCHHHHHHHHHHHQRRRRRRCLLHNDATTVGR